MTINDNLKQAENFCHSKCNTGHGQTDAEIHIAAVKDGMIANTEKTLAACQVDPHGFRKYFWLRRNKEIEN